ncbi:MAG: RNA polymerase sigma factor RpoD/SigA [Candidatus Riflebacteria bacterium]|nr:RNA polymerase sigma factor RpoD/SigA [Candidatus Riflebacteria bacterium]
MYCFRALNCNKIDCPVRIGQIRQCWEYFQTSFGREPTHEECPYEPCSTCHYRMGWEIGLITEEVFPSDELPETAALLPEKETSLKFLPAADVPLSGNKEIDEFFKNVPEVRFCWELTKCENLECPVRQQKIIRCFKFFERREVSEKVRITKCDLHCDQCRYKHGWEMGIITEELFADVINQKRISHEKSERINREGIIEIYLNEISKKPFTKDQEMELAKKLAGDKKASELFLMANLKLVVRIATGFSNKGLNILDLIQEGNLGLIKAISKFDYSLGYKFSTYAAYWVKHYMQKALREQGRGIIVPHHLLIIANKIRRVISEQETFLGRAPSLSELSILLGMAEEKILRVIALTESPISIESKVASQDEDGDTMEYYLADKKNLSPEEQILENAKKEECRKALDSLPERLKDIVELFYGFKEEEISLAEIGRRYEISRERARQLLRQALEILEHSSFSSSLSDFK